jgi:hypothetical protein
MRLETYRFYPQKLTLKSVDERGGVTNGKK